MDRLIQISPLSPCHRPSVSFVDDLSFRISSRLTEQSASSGDLWIFWLTSQVQAPSEYCVVRENEIERVLQPAERLSSILQSLAPTAM